MDTRMQLDFWGVFKNPDRRMVGDSSLYNFLEKAKAAKALGHPREAGFLKNVSKIPVAGR